MYPQSCSSRRFHCRATLFSTLQVLTKPTRPMDKALRIWRLYPLLLVHMFLFQLVLAKEEEWVHRILQKDKVNNNDNNVGLTCRMSNEQKEKLLCACFNNRRMVHLVFRSESFFLVNHPGHRSARVLELINCSLYIGSDFFINLSANLRSIVINGAKDLQLERGSLDLEDPLSFTVQSSALSMAIPAYTFGSKLISVLFDHVHFAQFTTDTFRGVSSRTRVVLDHCLVHTSATHHSHPTLESLELDSIVLQSTRFIGITEPVVDVDRLKELLIFNCTLDLYAKGAFSIRGRAEQALIVDSLLNVRGEALVIRAQTVVLQRVTLVEPKQRALAKVNGVSSESRLVLKDLVLIDPSKGSLLNTFPKVVFDNVLIQDGRCPCDLPNYLMAESDEFGLSIISNDLKNELKKKRIEALANATVCKVGNRRLRPSDACRIPQVDAGYVVVLVFLVLVFSIIALVATVFMVQWHSVLRERRNILRKIDVISNIERCKETHVTFDLEHVQMYSRPQSTLSTLVVDNNSDNELHQPDLVRGLSQGSMGVDDHINLDDMAKNDSKENLVAKRSTV